MVIYDWNVLEDEMRMYIGVEFRIFKDGWCVVNNIYLVIVLIILEMNGL